MMFEKKVNCHQCKKGYHKVGEVCPENRIKWL
ncbi:hypothetical protein LCGC14_1470030 [marine sediment metagenome]|uniref:Uncharacterized protein n=1 Tax=marine sediment metagenome TaxID=412755 RepID=A0A0F9JYJ9_9ZZZZ